VKTCKRCGDTKLVDQFHRDSGSSDGLRSSCRACRSDQMAAYYSINRGTKQVSAAEFRAANPDRIREADAARYRASRGKKLAWQRDYYYANIHVQWKNGYMKRARRYGLNPVTESFSRDDLIARWGDTCWHCGGPFEELDHYPLAVALGGAHTLDNCRPSCLRCNRAETAAVRARRRA